MKENKIKLIKESGIVAIIRNIDESRVLNVTNALLKGGIKCIEITFNTLNANKMISMIKKEFKDDVFVGAGTVIDEDTAKIAYDSGAEFILSPSLHKDVIEFCNNNKIISIPGAYTPTEIITAKQWGADIIKVFPAGAVKPEYIKMLKGPFNDIDMMAVGGINVYNVSDYIKNGCMSVGVGGALVNKKFIINEEYGKITNLAKNFIQNIKEARNI